MDRCDVCRKRLSAKKDRHKIVQTVTRNAAGSLVPGNALVIHEACEGRLRHGARVSR
jgi:hypothetical protein